MVSRSCGGTSGTDQPVATVAHTSVDGARVKIWILVVLGLATGLVIAELPAAFRTVGAALHAGLATAALAAATAASGKSLLRRLAVLFLAIATAIGGGLLVDPTLIWAVVSATGIGADVVMQAASWHPFTGTVLVVLVIDYRIPQLRAVFVSGAVAGIIVMILVPNGRSGLPPDGVLPRLSDTAERTVVAPGTDDAPDSVIHQTHIDAVACSYCHRQYAGEQPLSAPFIQATCAGCHTTVGPPSGAGLLEHGARIWDQGGCGGCHYNGSRLGPDLELVANWWALQPLSNEGMDLVKLGWPPVAAFMAEAIRNPRSHLPDNLSDLAQPAHMPEYDYAADDMEALVTWILAQRNWQYPANLSGPVRQLSAISPGQKLYNDPSLGCALCHQLRGTGGAIGPALDRWVGADPGKLAATLLDPDRIRVPGYPPLMAADLVADLTADEVRELVEFITGQP